jgi:hypothetical protein
MAFYAGGAMLGEVQATQPLAVVEVVEASRVSVGIPFLGGQAMYGIHDVRKGCIGKDAEILSTQVVGILPPGGIPMNKAPADAWGG